MNQIHFDLLNHIFFEHHFCQLDEGLIDWAISKGRGLKDTVVNTIASMKDWAHEKIVHFVRVQYRM